jgi:hypothetical protein
VKGWCMSVDHRTFVSMRSSVHITSYVFPIPNHPVVLEMWDVAVECKEALCPIFTVQGLGSIPGVSSGLDE